MKAKKASKNFLKSIRGKSMEDIMGQLKKAPIEVLKELLHEFDADDIPMLAHILTKTTKL